MRLLLLISCALALSACSGAKIEMRYWVIDLASPNSDVVLVIDGESHQLPVAIPMSSINNQWRISRAGDSLLEASLGSIQFKIESPSGESISLAGDLIYDQSASPVKGVKYTYVFLESDKQSKAASWRVPTAARLLADVENGTIVVVDPAE